MSIDQIKRQIKIILDMPKEQWFCVPCGVVYGSEDARYDMATNSNVHKCEMQGEVIEESLRQAFMNMFTRKSPKDRARGYGVR